jgi:hypothetical protein
MALEARRGWPNIPKPTAFGTVGYRKTMAMDSVQVGNQSLQIGASIVVETQGQLSYSFGFQSFMYSPQVSGLRSKFKLGNLKQGNDIGYSLVSFAQLALTQKEATQNGHILIGCVEYLTALTPVVEIVRKWRYILCERRNMTLEEPEFR